MNVVFLPCFFLVAVVIGEKSFAKPIRECLTVVARMIRCWSKLFWILPNSTKTEAGVVCLNTYKFRPSTVPVNPRPGCASYIYG